MFSTDFIKAKIRDVIVLSQKNRQPDEAPGAKFTLEMQIPNALLEHFDRHLIDFLFTAARSSSSNKTPPLEGFEVSDKPNLTQIGMHVGWLIWQQEMSGYVVEIDHGVGGKSNLRVTDSLLSAWRMLPKEGGTVIVRSSVESADVTEALFGKLAKLKSREVLIRFHPPTDAQLKLLEDKKKAEQARANEPKDPLEQNDPAAKRASKATQEFLERNGVGQGPAPGKNVKLGGGAKKAPAKKAAAAKKTAAPAKKRAR